jgi:hypothetical protein
MKKEKNKSTFGAEIKKQQIKQKIIATLVVVFMLVMIAGVVKFPALADQNSYTNLIQNFVTGTLSVEAPASLAFNNISIGIATNSLANMDYVNFRDYRGSGAGWSLTGTMNNMLTSGAGARNFVSNGNIAWFPQSATLIGLEGSSTTGIAKGSDGFFNALRTLANAGATYGMGNYRINSLNINIQYYGWANQVAGTYQNTLQLTIQ